MSDFAIGFYEILYQDILCGQTVLDNNGHFVNKEIAGDTMNSFNTIANKTPGAGKSRLQRTTKDTWPQELVNYKNTYHCLANLWILPMEMGRTTNGEFNKAKSPFDDYVDRFLESIRTNVDFNGNDRYYFDRFQSWNNFVHKHFLQDSYITEKMEVIEYSRDEQAFIRKANARIASRARCISNSKYADELWGYFFGLHLLES